MSNALTKFRHSATSGGRIDTSVYFSNAK